MSDYSRNKKPFIIPPPTQEELGVLPLEEYGTGFKAFRIFSIIVFICVISCGLALFFWLENLGVFNINDSVLQSISRQAPLDNSVVFDRNGKKIGEYFNHYHLYVPYDKLPKDLMKAIISIEDRNFFRHMGVDPKAILRAIRASIIGHGYQQGASTLTQQVVRHYLLSSEKTIDRKVKEIFLALRFEQVLTKQKILELYTNKLFLGNGAYGVGAAAQRYFGKSIYDLKTHEYALIAGLFQSPTRYNPSRYPERAKRRQLQVLKAMYQAKAITKREAERLAKEPLVYQEYKPINDMLAPYFVDYIRENAGGLINKQIEGQGVRIFTTLDSDLQMMANNSFANSTELFKRADELIIYNHKRKQEEPPSVEASMISLDPKTGEILAMVGGRDYRRSQFNRTVKAMRSPGSSFKPVVYSLALENGWKWSDLLFVSPVSINGYRPKNYSDKFLTETTLLKAFYQSLNTAAVELGDKLGVDAIIEHAMKLGVRSTLKQEPGTILGSSEITMMDLARVYSVFANYGKLVEPVAITRIEDREGHVLFQLPPPKERATPVMSPEIAYLMTQGMRSVITNGTGQSARELADKVVGKTGTSNDSQDNWFAGYSPNLLTVTWVGTDDHLPMDKPAAGGTLALPIWHEYMSQALTKRSAGGFYNPGGVVSYYVDPQYGNSSANGLKMYFLRGTGPASSHSEFQQIEEEGDYRSLFGH